ncbi:MAG: TonB-dependent receptor, partial [Deltaproteobacteria bacterium]
ATGAFTTLIGNIGLDAHLVQPRLELDFEPFKLQLFYVGQVTDLSIDNDITLGETLLANFNPSTLAYGHVVDGDFQYNLPKFWDPLLVITGIRARGSWINSDDALSYDYVTPGSDSYHEPGVSWSEFRAGGFLHLELAPADWVFITAGGRVDYDTTAGSFVSPRLAAVFKPIENNYLRLGVARSFRKPSFQESGLHPMLVFPESGPIQPDEQQDYLEFMARNIGNPNLEHEQMLAFEAGWRSNWLDGILKTRLDVYINRATNIIDFDIKPAFLPTGLPDLEKTSMRFDNEPGAKLAWGVELDVRYQPNKNVVLRAGWSYRDTRSETTPKNLFLVGGRFKSEAGLLGSLYLIGRGEYLGTKIQNPEGLFSPSRRAHLPSVGIFIGRLGYRLRLGNEQKLEIGAKWYVPVDVENWRLRYHGRAGLIGPDGTTYGGEPLEPRVTFYLEGWL